MRDGSSDGGRHLDPRGTRACSSLAVSARMRGAMNAASNRAEQLEPASTDALDDAAPPTFSSFGPREHAQRSWRAAMLSSSAIYVGVVVALVTLGTATKKVIEEKRIDVTFVEKIVKEAATAAAARRGRSRRPRPRPRSGRSPGPEDPQARQAAAAEGAGRAEGDAAGSTEGSRPEPGQGHRRLRRGRRAIRRGSRAAGRRGRGRHVGGAIALPEDGDPPMPRQEQRDPAVPAMKRAHGRQDRHGDPEGRHSRRRDRRRRAGDARRGAVRRAAVQAVKKWRYEPARYKGQPITVYRIIQIPFKLNA